MAIRDLFIDHSILHLFSSSVRLRRRRSLIFRRRNTKVIPTSLHRSPRARSFFVFFFFQPSVLVRHSRSSFMGFFFSCGRRYYTHTHTHTHTRRRSSALRRIVPSTQKKRHRKKRRRQREGPEDDADRLIHPFSYKVETAGPHRAKRIC